MSALTRNPENPNFLHGNKFQLNFDRNPNIQYFCQKINIPGISSEELTSPNPFIDLYIPGDSLQFEALKVTFLVDEEMLAWIEVHEWLRGLTFPNDFSEYRAVQQNIARPIYKEVGNQYSDGTLTILSSASQPIMRFMFIDMFPTSLSGIELSTGLSPTDVVTATATYRYSYYQKLKL